MKEAGFTLDQIIALCDIYDVSKPEQQQQEEKPEEKPVEFVKDEENSSGGEWNKVLKAITDLTKTVQASNINNSQIGDANAPKADDALAYILDPYAGKS